MFWCKRGLPSIFGRFRNNSRRGSTLSITTLERLKKELMGFHLKLSTRCNFDLNRTNITGKLHLQLIFSGIAIQ
jgi:hypothetical protein